MAEKVDVIRVGEGARLKEIAKKSPEKYAIGVYKAINTNSWEVGILAREAKLEKIEKAAKFNKEVTEMFVQWCIENNLTVNYTVAGMYRRAAALLIKFGERHADLYVNSAIPPKYRPFWATAKEILKSKYRAVRG
jgi:hypothetical protein